MKPLIWPSILKRCNVKIEFPECNVILCQYDPRCGHGQRPTIGTFRHWFRELQFCKWNKMKMEKKMYSAALVIAPEFSMGVSIHQKTRKGTNGV